MQVATLVIAVFGISLSMLSLTWQAVNYVLTGSRARVELLVIETYESGNTASYHLAGLTSYYWEILDQAGSDRHRLAVRVRSVGRMPVTIESWSICIAPVKAQSRFHQLLARKPDFAVLFTPESGSTIGPPLPHQLDAGGPTATWSISILAMQEFVLKLAEGGPVESGSFTVYGLVELGDGSRRDGGHTRWGSGIVV